MKSYKAFILILCISQLSENLYSQNSSKEYVLTYSKYNFDISKYEFVGSYVEQALLLLRTVYLKGKLERQEAQIDSSFLRLLGSKLNISGEKYKTYLDSMNIHENEIGGSLGQPLSYILHDGEKKYATYFVIHDVSAPVYLNTFAANINSKKWPYNKHSIWSGKHNHIYIMRDGSSKTVVDFSQGWRATKMENIVLGRKSRGLFLHIELIQPRKFPPGDERSAQEAPTPGFTDDQYARLAIVYLAASIRKGEWLIPGFHACIDDGIYDGHDDPQKFVLKQFTDEVLRIYSELK